MPLKQIFYLKKDWEKMSELGISFGGKVCTNGFWVILSPLASGLGTTACVVRGGLTALVVGASVSLIITVRDRGSGWGGPVGWSIVP